jgi:hypothetical protein
MDIRQRNANGHQHVQHAKSRIIRSYAPNPRAISVLQGRHQLLEEIEEIPQVPTVVDTIHGGPIMTAVEVAVAEIRVADVEIHVAVLVAAQIADRDLIKQ